MTDPQPSSRLPVGVFAGRADFQQLIRDAIQAAADEGWREMIWFDLTFDELRLKFLIDFTQAYFFLG